MAIMHLLAFLKKDTYHDIGFNVYLAPLKHLSEKGNAMMQMRKLLRLFAIAAASAMLLSAPVLAGTPPRYSSNTQHIDYNGLWWTPGEPGWAVNLTESNDFVFATILSYDTQGKPVWYTAEMKTTWGSCSIDEDLKEYACRHAWGNLYAVEGKPSGVFLGAKDVKTDLIGTISFSVSSPTEGILYVSNFFRDPLEWTTNNPIITIPSPPAQKIKLQKQTLTAPYLSLYNGAGASPVYTYTTALYMEQTAKKETGRKELFRGELMKPQMTVSALFLPTLIGDFSFNPDKNITCHIKGPMVAMGDYYTIKDAEYRCDAIAPDGNLCPPFGAWNDFEVCHPAVHTIADFWVRFTKGMGINGYWRTKEKAGYSNEAYFSATFQAIVN